MHALTLDRFVDASPSSHISADLTHGMYFCNNSISTPDGVMITQVHAVSSKASDVRSVVMELNAKRQAADEAADAPLQALAAQEGHTVPEQDNTVTWHEYNEVKIASVQCPGPAVSSSIPCLS